MSHAWRHAVAQRFAGFETAAEASFVIAQSPTAGAGIVAGGPPPAEIRVVSGETILEMRGPGFSARIDLERRRAEIAGPEAAYPADMLLRELLPLLSPHSLILHCALLSDGDRAWACAGPSGCGKSTLAGLIPERALCDELASMSCDTGRFRARSLPYWDARPGGGDLAGVMLLRHGDAQRRRRISPERAFAELVPEVVWPSVAEKALARCLATLGDLAERIPAWELEFAPRADVWNAITAEA